MRAGLGGLAPIASVRGGPPRSRSPQEFGSASTPLSPGSPFSWAALQPAPTTRTEIMVMPKQGLLLSIVWSADGARPLSTRRSPGRSRPVRLPRPASDPGATYRKRDRQRSHRESPRPGLAWHRSKQRSESFLSLLNLLPRNNTAGLVGEPCHRFLYLTRHALAGARRPGARKHRESGSADLPRFYARPERWRHPSATRWVATVRSGIPTDGDEEATARLDAVRVGSSLLTPRYCDPVRVARRGMSEVYRRGARPDRGCQAPRRASRRQGAAAPFQAGSPCGGPALRGCAHGHDPRCKRLGEPPVHRDVVSGRALEEK